MLPRLRAFALPLGAAALLTLLLQLAPVVRAAGYKSLLILGVAASLALPLAWLLRSAAARDLTTLLRRRAAAFFTIALLPALLTLLLAPLTTQGCEIPEGLGMLLLGHLPGLTVAFGLCELLEASHLRRPAARAAAFGLLWIALLVAAFGWFLTQPVYQVAHPLVGLFLGPPNEAHDPWVPRCVAFAAEHLAWGAAFTLAARAWRAPRPRRWRLLLPPVLTAAAALALLTFSPELGYRINSARVQRELRVQHRAHHIQHYAAPTIPADARPWLYLEAEFQRSQQQRLLHLPNADLPNARIYWFRDEDQKADLTGARRTKFAKVHRGEVYLSGEQFPPRTVGHELAHVTSAAFSHTLLRVPGRLGGLWYNPALVEGFAVAVAWDDFPLSAHEQARIALDKDRLPPLSDLFSPLGFATTNLSIAYRASGSFMRFCFDTFGVEPTLRWYTTEDFEVSLGLPLHDAERQWHAFLRTLDVREQDRGRVEEVQTRPSIGQEACGRSQRDDDLRDAQRAGDDDEVLRLLRTAGDPDADPELWIALWTWRAERARYRCDLPKAPPAPLEPAQERAWTRTLAFQRWATSRPAQAEQLLASLPPSARSQDEVITARILLRDGFTLDDHLPDDLTDPTLLRGHLLRQQPHPAIAHALAMEQWRAQRWRSLDDALQHVTWDGFAFPDGNPGTLVLGTLQMQGLAAFALRDFPRALAAWERYLQVANTQGRRAYGETWRDRTRFFQHHQERLTADLPRL